MTQYVTRNHNGEILTISKLPRVGREPIADDDPEILVIRSRQADAKQQVMDQSPAEILRRITQLEADVATFKRTP